MKHLLNWLTKPQPVSLMTFMSPVIVLAVMFIGFVLLKVNIMQTEQIITALHNAKLYEAAKLQCDNANIDKLSMIIAVATGNVATYKVLYDMFCQLQSGSQTYNII